MVEQFPPEYGLETATKLRRIDDMSAADFVIAASRIEQVDEYPIEILKIDTEQFKELWQAVQDRYWFMMPEYRNKEPHEQWVLEVAGDTIPLYNYAENFTLTSTQVTRIAFNMGRFASVFPAQYPHLQAVTILDKPYGDPLEDDMACAYPEASLVELSTYALEEGTYRPDFPVTRLDAVILHELAHFHMDELLESAWEEAGYYWDRVIGYSEKLQYYANQPEACVTEYAARGGVHEDIAESVAAYLLAGSKLDDAKRLLIKPHESWLRIQPIRYEKLPQIIIPQLPAELTYYLDHTVSDRE